MSAEYLFINLFVSVFGAAYWIYGKRQSELWFMLAGAGLTFYPWLVSNLFLMLVIGVVLTALPFVINRLDS